MNNVFLVSINGSFTTTVSNKIVERKFKLRALLRTARLVHNPVLYAQIFSTFASIVISRNVIGGHVPTPGVNDTAGPITR